MNRRKLITGAAAIGAMATLNRKARALSSSQINVLFDQNLQPNVSPHPVPSGLVNIAPLGDSRTAIIAFDTLFLNQASSSHLNWMNAVSSWRYPYTGVFALSGITSTTIVQQYLYPALLTKPAAVTILMGINDQPAGISIYQSVQNMLTAIKAIFNASATPIIFTDPGNTGFTTQQCALWHGAGGYNDQLRAIAANDPGILLVDWISTVLASTNPIVWNTDPSGNPYSADGTHFDVPGGCVAGAYADSIISPYFGAPGAPFTGNNFVTNSAFAGTSGTLGTGNTGTLPTSWTGSRDNANCSAAFSINVRGDGATEVVMVMTTNNTVGVFAGVKITQTITSLNNLQVCSEIRASMQADIDAASVLTDVYVQFTATFNDASFQQVYCFRSASANKGPILTTNPNLLTLVSDPFTMPAGKFITSIAMVAGAQTTGTGISQTATVRFRKIALIPQPPGQISGHILYVDGVTEIQEAGNPANVLAYTRGP